MLDNGTMPYFISNAITNKYDKIIFGLIIIMIAVCAKWDLSRMNLLLGYIISYWSSNFVLGGKNLWGVQNVCM